mgnify:FL=1
MFLKWFRSTSNRSFALYPLIVVGETLIKQQEERFVFWGSLFLLWGYLQYKLTGNYRTKIGGGGPGLDKPPNGIVITGIYGYVRNPMYLGHLIFYIGLIIAFKSLIAFAILLFHLPWFEIRVRRDEINLEQEFGSTYVEYKNSVKRWIPFVY